MTRRSELSPVRFIIIYKYIIAYLAIFLHEFVDGNSGRREGDDGRDTKTTNAGFGQANLVRPLATATVCSIPGLRIGARLGGEPGGPGLPSRVQLTATPAGTESKPTI
jgi:hypothetical protein